MNHTPKQRVQNFGQTSTWNKKLQPYSVRWGALGWC